MTRAMPITAFVAALLLAACGDPPAPPEEAVRDWIARAEAAAEAADRATLTDMIAPGYVDARGNDREAIDRLFRLYFLRQKNIGLLVDINELDILGSDAAKVLLTVGMAASNDGVLGFSADAYRFELELRADDDDWQLIGARWAELGRELR